MLVSAPEAAGGQHAACGRRATRILHSPRAPLLIVHTLFANPLSIFITNLNLCLTKHINKFAQLHNIFFGEKDGSMYVSNLINYHDW